MGASSFSPSPITTTPFIETVASTARIPSTAPWSADSFSPRPTQRAAPIAPASVTRTSSSARFRSGGRPLIGQHPSRVEQLHLCQGSRLVVGGVARLAELAHALGDDGLHRRARILQVP